MGFWHWPIRKIDCVGLPQPGEEEIFYEWNALFLLRSLFFSKKGSECIEDNGYKCRLQSATMFSRV